MWTSFFNSAVRRADASFKSSHCTHKMGTLDTPTELPNPCRFVCTHGCQAMERRQQQFWLIPGHQKNAATRDALIYSRQCLITEIAFSRESSLKFNAVFAWQYSRTHDHCDKIQYPPAQQGSLLTSRPERELGKPTYTGPRLGTNLTSVAGQVFSGTGIFWTHKTSLALQGTARPLSQCGSYHPLPHNLVQSSPGGHSSQSNQDLSGSAGCGPGRLQHHGKTLLHFSQYRDTSVIFIKNFSHLVSFLPATQSLNYLKSVSQKKKKIECDTLHQLDWTFLCPISRWQGKRNLPLWSAHAGTQPNLVFYKLSHGILQETWTSCTLSGKDEACSVLPTLFSSSLRHTVLSVEA